VPVFRKLACSLLSIAAVGIIPLSVRAQSDSAIVPNRYIIVYRNAAIPGDAEIRAVAAGARLLQRNDRFGVATVQSIGSKTSALPRTLSIARDNDDAIMMQRLASQPNVEYVLHDRIVTASHLNIRPVAAEPTFHVTVTQPYDTYYNSPQGWAVRQVGGYGAGTPGGPSQGPWDTTTGKGVRIAILDSGVDQNHPDIAPKLDLNLTEVNRNDLPSPCDDGSPQDQEGHGTWTASLAAAAMGPGTGQVIGVAPAATILNIKVLERLPANISGNATTASRCTAGEASGLLSWVIQGIQDAIINHADVVSLSLGATIDLSTGEGAGLKAAFDRITYAASQAGAVLVAAAGNDGYNLANPRYIEIPAQARGVLAIVASTNPACAQNSAPYATCAPGPATLAYYSNYGTPLNALAAPGGSYPVGNDDHSVTGWIRGACSSGLSNTIDGIPSDAQHSFGCFNLGHADYVQAIGTSASAPLAAGAAALVRAAHPDWDPATVIAKLRSSASAIPSLPVPQVNAAAALNQH
jgi:lantibiotic leader peptide-processing serine protease